MKGIEFVVDDAGDRKAVLIDRWLTGGRTEAGRTDQDSQWQETALRQTRLNHSPRGHHEREERRDLHTLARHKSSIRAFGTRCIGLLGSQDRDETSAKSDLDFLVEFEPGADIRWEMRHGIHQLRPPSTIHR